MTFIFDDQADNPELRACVGEIIGTPLDELESRAGQGCLSKEDIAAAVHLEKLVIAMRVSAQQSSAIVEVALLVSSDAVRCCLCTPPGSEDEDLTQRIMQHILEIQRLARGFSK